MNTPPHAAKSGNSMPPQLIETTDTPGREAAVRVAVNRSSGVSLLASTSTMLAPGATACAHSTSKDSSNSHSPVASCGGNALLPYWLTTANSGGAGKPKTTSKIAKSRVMVGSS